MTPLVWLRGLIAAIIGGTATALTSIGGASAFGSPLDWKQISAVAASAAFFSGAAYLKQSPIPDDITVKEIKIEPSKVTTTTTTIPQNITLPPSVTQPIEDKYSK